jgi:hypothetical protein
MLLAPLVIASDAVLGEVSYIIRRCLPVAACGCLSTRLCGVVHGRLIVSGEQDGNAAWLLECAPE